MVFLLRFTSRLQRPSMSLVGGRPALALVPRTAAMATLSPLNCHARSITHRSIHTSAVAAGGGGEDYSHCYPKPSPKKYDEFMWEQDKHDIEVREEPYDFPHVAGKGYRVYSGPLKAALGGWKLAFSAAFGLSVAHAPYMYMTFPAGEPFLSRLQLITLSVAVPYNLWYFFSYWTSPYIKEIYLQPKDPKLTASVITDPSLGLGEVPITDEDELVIVTSDFLNRNQEVRLTVADLDPCDFLWTAEWTNRLTGDRLFFQRESAQSPVMVDVHNRIVENAYQRYVAEKDALEEEDKAVEPSATVHQPISRI